MKYYVYYKTQLDSCQNISQKIKEKAECGLVNTGGDILTIGNFILLNNDNCVTCASENNIDYCRNILKRIVTSIKKVKTLEWKKILDQLIINQEEPKE